MKGTLDCGVTGASLCHLNFDIQCKNRTECESRAGSCSDSKFLVDLNSKFNSKLFITIKMMLMELVLWIEKDQEVIHLSLDI